MKLLHEALKKAYESIKPNKVPEVLEHITDVGSNQFEGVDSLYRIRQQYQNVNVRSPFIIPAGHSPLHVAFTGATCLSKKARENAKLILSSVCNISQKKRLPIALNSAPRNSNKILENGKEDNIFWIKTEDSYADYLVYGMQVVEWIVAFHKVVSVKKIVSINDVIQDTSHGSQFRSAEHLPLVHILLAMDNLESHAIIENFRINDLIDRRPEKCTAIIAPCDEYYNGRLIMNKECFNKILADKKSIVLLEDSKEVGAYESLTTVIPGKLSIWPSSNHFPNEDLVVLNIGTRWKEGTTYITNEEIKNFVKILNKRVGESISFS